MKKIGLLLMGIVCLGFFNISAQTTFKMFDNELFIDGYANGKLAKYNDSLPPSAGVKRLRTSLVSRKFSPEQLASIGNTLSLKVLIKASCDNYDRLGYVHLAFVHKGDSTYKIDSTVKRIEIARFITPFMNKNKKPDTVPYLYEVNNVASILNEKHLVDSFDIWCELEVFGVPYAANTQITGCAGRADVCFGTVEFTTSNPHADENNNILLALGDGLSFNNYQAKATDILGQTVKTISFTLPSKSYNTKLYLITSNHGAGTNGEEYNRRSHFVYVDEALVLGYTPGFETCEPYRKYNTQSNGIYGSSPMTNEQWQSFSNWCPGAYIPTRIINMGVMEAGTHSFRIEVPGAIFQGSDGNFPLSLYVQGKTEPVTGVAEMNNQLSNIAIYPNPGSEMISVLTEMDVKQITVYNMLGKQVLETGSTVMNISELSNGVYFVKVELNNGQHAIKKFEKK